jgi:hypothetical protein
VDRIQVKLQRVLSGLGIRLSGRLSRAPVELDKPTVTWRNAVTPLHGPVPSMGPNTVGHARARLSRIRTALRRMCPA